jgi:hypothetical protein
LRANPAMIYFFSTCPYLIESLPALPMDKKNPEDVDTTSNDHAADALRYLCKERLLDPQYEDTEAPIIHQGSIRISQYIEKCKREMKARDNI